MRNGGKPYFKVLFSAAPTPACVGVDVVYADLRLPPAMGILAGARTSLAGLSSTLPVMRKVEAKRVPSLSRGQICERKEQRLPTEGIESV